MSLAARCPWCETVFRLTEGQVSAKGGMARCGVCNHTFNALDALLSDSAVAALERSAQAREANQEATARANQQIVSKAAEPSPSSTPIPISIRKIFGGSNTATPAPVPSHAAPSPSGAPSTVTGPVLPVALAKTAPNSSSPLISPSPSSPSSPSSAPIAPIAPIAAPTGQQLASLPAEEQTTPPAAVTRPVASTELPQQAQLPKPFAQSERQPQPTSMPLDLRAAQPVTKAQPADQPPAPTSIPAATAASINPSSSDTQQAAPAGAMPVDYKVEMPNYDAERAARLANAERLQKELQERNNQKEQREAQGASSTVAQQLDALQSALSPGSSADQAAHQDIESAASSVTLDSLRLQHSAVQAATKADLLREEERLGPNTFQPSFLLSTPSPGRFRGTRRFLASVLAVILFVCLLAQAAYWWRSDIAVRVPQTRPYLTLACERLHCELEPPAQIDQLSIESSELVAAPGAAGTLAFTALVRNHSVNALAYPAIEITLTDARDQAILRRVFLPDAYLGEALASKRLAGLPGNSEYTLKLTFNTSGVATSGYRAGIFYP